MSGAEKVKVLEELYLMINLHRHTTSIEATNPTVDTTSYWVYMHKLATSVAEITKP